MMDKKPTWWQIMKLKISFGRPFAPVENLGKLKAHNVIRYKDYYIGVMELEDGSLNLSWSESPHMFPDVNINDFWSSAEPERGAMTTASMRSEEDA